jgi:hypothetical protein
MVKTEKKADMCARRRVCFLHENPKPPKTVSKPLLNPVSQPPQPQTQTYLQAWPRLLAAIQLEPNPPVSTRPPSNPAVQQNSA